MQLLTLSTTGIIKHGNTIIERLFQYFIRTSPSQTDFYIGEIASYRQLKHEHGGDRESMGYGCVKVLTKMYDRYFAEVEINVNFVQDPNHGNVWMMVITGTMKSKTTGQAFVLNQDMRYGDDTLSNAW